MKNKYYSGKNIRAKGARYNVIFGERSNGKTYDVLFEAAKDFFKSGERNQLGLIRRMDEDFVGAKSARTMYDSLVVNGEGENVIAKLSNGKYDGVEYYAGKYYLTAANEDKTKSVRTGAVLAYGFSISSAEHYKSGAFPNIKTILFDEFITRTRYLTDEFVQFQNLLSTIIRKRDDVIIYMCGNTVNKYCPYFREMGLYRVKQMKQGDIDVYTYGDTGLVVAVEYSDSPSKGKDSDVYFAFDNPKLNMIKNGAWEIDIYPHCPAKYAPKHILFTYFVCFDDSIMQCEVVQVGRLQFTFVHMKTTPLKDENRDLIYTTEYDPRPNYRRNLLKPVTDLERKLCEFYRNDKVFYQDNDTGELMRNYLIWCRRGTT